MDAYKESECDNRTSTPEAISEDTFANVIFVVQMILSATGILGNSLVCLTIARAKFMHNITNFFIAHMALADTLVCVLMIIFQERYLGQDFPWRGNTAVNNSFCQLFFQKIILWVVCDVSIFSMVCVNVERYVAIVHPLKYPRFFTKARLVIITVAVWCAAVVVKAPVSAYKYDMYDSTQNRCTYDTLTTGTVMFVPAVVSAIINLLGPAIILCGSYVKILNSLHKSAIDQQRSNNHAPAKELLLARRKVVKVLFIVSVLYLVLWFPIYIFFCLMVFDNGLSWDTLQVLILLQPTLAVVNSVVNPFVYAFKYKEFQRGVRDHVLPFWFHRGKASVAPQRSHGIATITVSSSN